MSRDADISLADLALALDRLAPKDEATRRGIAHLLGLDLRVPRPDPEEPGKAREKRARALRGPGQMPTPEPDADDIAAIESGAAAATASPVELEWLEADAEIALSTGADTLPDAAPLPRPTRARRAPPPAPTLFRRVWQRALIHRTVAMPVFDGDIDVDTMIDRALRREPVKRLPRRVRDTARMGVQLLLDRSRSMAPFFSDMDRLGGELFELAPEERSEVLSFFECPGRGVAGRGEPEPRPHRSPFPPRVVLIVSDFGQAPPRADEDRANQGEWLDFARGVRDAGCPLIGLTPYGPDRWPDELRASIGLVQWDRTTKLAQLIAARRDSG